MGGSFSFSIPSVLPLGLPFSLQKISLLVLVLSLPLELVRSPSLLGGDEYLGCYMGRNCTVHRNSPCIHPPWCRFAIQPKNWAISSDIYGLIS